jgi:endonuclease YncB( thermonuclease family)
LSLLLCGSLCAVASAQFLSAIPREWTIDGKRVEAVFLSNYEGVVTLARSSNNEKIEVKFEDLNDEDREFIDGLSTELPQFKPPPGPIKVRGQVIEVVDGDTLTLLIDGQTFCCRLKGIDAPELKQPFGREAGVALHRACFGKVVQAEGHGEGHYGRQLVVIKLGRRNLNQEMIAKGLAWQFRPLGADKQLVAAEQRARQRRRGLWASPEPVKPWEWRQAHEENPAEN